MCNKQYLITETFLEKIDITRSEAAIRSQVKRVLNEARELQPIHFSLLQARDFIAWLLTLKKKMTPHLDILHSIHTVLVPLTCFGTTE